MNPDKTQQDSNVPKFQTSKMATLRSMTSHAKALPYAFRHQKTPVRLPVSALFFGFAVVG